MGDWQCRDHIAHANFEEIAGGARARARCAAATHMTHIIECLLHNGAAVAAMPCVPHVRNVLPAPPLAQVLGTGDVGAIRAAVENALVGAVHARRVQCHVWPAPPRV